MRDLQSCSRALDDPMVWNRLEFMNVKSKQAVVAGCGNCQVMPCTTWLGHLCVEILRSGTLSSLVIKGSEKVWKHCDLSYAVDCF